MRFVILFALVLACPVSLLAADGVQITPDNSQILASKDVGNERWAIALSLSESNPLYLTGNVFFRDGRSPQFLQCDIRDVIGDPNDIRNAQFQWACFGADACPQAPCARSQWQFISDVTLGGHFFLP